MQYEAYMKISNQIGILGEKLFSMYFQIFDQTDYLKHYDRIIKNTKLEIKTSTINRFNVRKEQHDYLCMNYAYYCFVDINTKNGTVHYYFANANNFNVNAKETNISTNQIKHICSIHFKVEFPTLLFNELILE